MAFSGDGAKLATADAEGTIKIWADAQKLTSKSTALLDAQGPSRGDHIPSVFRAMASGSSATSADKTARVWDLENAGAAIRPLERSDGRCLVARFSPDGQLIAAARRQQRVRLWDAATGQLVRELSAGDKGRIYSVAFSPTDNRLLAVGYGGHEPTFLMSRCGTSMPERNSRGCRERPICPASVATNSRRGRCAGVFARWEISGRRFRLKVLVTTTRVLPIR